MVDRYVVLARVAKIRQYVALLKKIRGLASESTFVKDPLIYGNAERYLQLAIQSVLDVSNHIVADMNLKLPADRWPASVTSSFTSIWRSIGTGSIAR